MVRDYLLKHPEVLREVIDALDKPEKAAEKAAAMSVISARSKEIFRSADDHVAGNPEGKDQRRRVLRLQLRLLPPRFADVIKLLEGDKDLRVVFKEFPILGPGSVSAAQGFHCGSAAEQILGFPPCADARARQGRRGLGR